MNFLFEKNAAKGCVILLAFTGFSFIPAKAQTTASAVSAETEAVATGNSNYDPISAMLDSLVTLNYVQRLNFASTGTQQNNFQPHEIPTYGDDVYAKRLSKIQSPIPLTFNQQVKEYIDLYAVHKRALTERVMGLSQLYFPLYEQILDQNNLPLEFKYLSIVESALNATAVSRAGATGLWQFMLGTGKLYNLKVNSFIDERRDPIKSTQAACQYFQNMYDIYHDWLLVIAAYNCGAGNVNKAIARCQKKYAQQGEGTASSIPTFWQISRYLPLETRGYVPAFIAVTYLMNYATDHNLAAVPPIISFHEADTVLVDQKISLREIADAIDVPHDLLTYLNPVYKRGVIPDMDEPQALRLPANKVYAYIANSDKIFQSTPSPSFAQDDGSSVNPLEYVTKLVKKFHVVKRGERMATIADKYDCTIGDIKRWNKIRSSKVFKGQRLLVYVPVTKPAKSTVQTGTLNNKLQAAVSEKSPELLSSNDDKGKMDPTHSDSALNSDNKVAEKTKRMANRNSNDNSSLNKNVAKSNSFVWHIVQPGDTLWKIARSYDGVTVEEIKAINNLSSNEITPGTKLKVKVTG